MKIEKAQENVRLAVLLTCHNRSALTLACLDGLYRQILPKTYYLDIVVVDDGSSDGTSELIKARYPQVMVIYGDGSLYWGGGMRMAFAAALEKDYDFYVWMNDDVTMRPDALSTMLGTFGETKLAYGRSPIIVGAFDDPVTGKLSYGGWRANSRLFPTRMKRMEKAERVQECDGANGNCLLIPRDVARDVGNIDPAFQHSMGDFDYSLRAKKRGYPVLVGAGAIWNVRAESLRGQHQRQKKRYLGALEAAYVCQDAAIRGISHLSPEAWGVNVAGVFSLSLFEILG